MNRREKILACIVASLVFVALVGYAVRKVNDAFRTRGQRVNELDKEIRDKKDLDRFTQEHRDRMEVYKGKSLPSDLEEARSLYNEWLVDRASEAGFVDPLVKPVPPRTTSKGKVYNALGFTVTGKGNLEQMIKFLHTFYSADYLHRISRLHAHRVRDSKQLDLTIWVDALSLPTATNEGLSDEPSNRLAHKDLVAYRDVIVYRNLFGPPNNEPTMESIGERTGYQGRTVEITVAGRDPDELDKLIYTFDSDDLPDGCLDGDSGQFEWTPEELGEFEVTITATDDGYPPKSVSQTFMITVTEGPDEPEEVADLPSFEKARFAYVSGITESNGRKLAWINLRTEDRLLLLSEGDEFDVGEVKVTVRRILEPEKKVELEATVLKKRLLVSMGQNLAEGNVLPSEEG
jgi:hypothetical protein